MIMAEKKLLSFKDAMLYLGLNSRDALYSLQKSQDFPQALKMGATRQAPLMFVTSELDQWIELQKSKRPSTPNQYGSIVTKKSSEG